MTQDPRKTNQQKDKQQGGYGGTKPGQTGRYDENKKYPEDKEDKY